MKKVGIYLDYAATTPIDEVVATLMHDIVLSVYGNAGSIHTPGRVAKKHINDARSNVAKVIGAEPDEIIFTGSGTEADNLAVLGIAQANKKHGKHIIVSAIEHKAVLESAARLKNEGFEVSYAQVDKDGILDIKEFKKLLRKDTILVSIVYANNEVGTIQPIKEISKILRPHREKTGYPIFHSDACQAAGILSMNVRDLGVDALTINGSKIYGPKGIGCLYVKSGVAISPQIVGGGQEWHKRAGTENVALIAGMAKALTIAVRKQKKENARLAKLRDYCIDKIQRSIPHAHLNGHATKRLPNNINFSFSQIEGEALVLLLDQAGIYCSTGSACSSSDLSPSHVLLAIGLTPELAHGSLRLTLGRDTTKKDIDVVLRHLVKIVTDLRKISAIKV